MRISVMGLGQMIMVVWVFEVRKLDGLAGERGGRRRQSSRRISMMTGASSRRSVAKTGMCICV